MRHVRYSLLVIEANNPQNYRNGAFRAFCISTCMFAVLIEFYLSVISSTRTGSSYSLKASLIPLK